MCDMWCHVYMVTLRAPQIARSIDCNAFGHSWAISSINETQTFIEKCVAIGLLGADFKTHHHLLRVAKFRFADAKNRVSCCKLPEARDASGQTVLARAGDNESLALLLEAVRFLLKLETTWNAIWFNHTVHGHNPANQLIWYDMI